MWGAHVSLYFIDNLFFLKIGLIQAAFNPSVSSVSPNSITAQFNPLSTLLQSTVGSGSSGYKAYAKANKAGSVNKKPFLVRLKAGVTPVNLAKGAATAILSKNAVGIVALAGLSYVLTDDGWKKTIPGETIPATPPQSSTPILTAPIVSGSNRWCYSTTLSNCRDSPQAAWLAVLPSDTATISLSDYVSTVSFASQTADRYNANRVYPNGNTAVVQFHRLLGGCPSGTSWNQTQKQCYYITPLCTQGTYFPSLNECLTSTEPCPSGYSYSQYDSSCEKPSELVTFFPSDLENDLLTQLDTSPEIAPQVLDQTFENGVDVETDTATIDDISPSSISSDTTVSSEEYVDPQTGNPTTKQTERAKQIQLEPGPQSGTDTPTIKITETVTETVTTTDNTTNTTNIITKTETNEGNQPPDEPTEPPKTDCELFPNSIGCSEYGSVPDNVNPEIVELDYDLQPTYDEAGYCPEPINVNLSALAVSIPLDHVCNFAIKIKPVILALAWLVAAQTIIRTASKQ